MGMLHDDQALTAYPMAIGAMAPPTFAKVFMHPVTVPAYSDPMSWQTAHAGVIDRSAMPAATAISKAAVIGLTIIAAAARAAPLTVSEIAATPHRPILRPNFFDQWSVHSPPAMLADAPLKSTMLDR